MRALFPPLSLTEKVAALFLTGAAVSSLTEGTKAPPRPAYENTGDFVHNVASRYAHAVVKGRGRTPAEDALRREMEGLFRNDVEHVRWRWNGELEWTGGAAPPLRPAP